MRDDFAIFILTHGRADNIKTLKLLEDGNYTGKWYLVIDNEDKQADEYFARYGDRVVMFDKEAMSKRFDTMDQSNDRRMIVYARNYCFDLAKELGLTYFLEFDDDYYGAETYEKACNFLYASEKQYGLIGYRLCNTLYSVGKVTRGICEIDSEGHLVGIRETKNVKIEEGTGRRLNGNEIVSMNFWLFPSSFCAVVEDRYERFIRSMKDTERDEYLLPNIVDDMIRNDNVCVDVIRTNAHCYGMTHEEDKETVTRHVLRETLPPHRV